MVANNPNPETEEQLKAKADQEAAKAAQAEEEAKAAAEAEAKAKADEEAKTATAKKAKADADAAAKAAKESAQPVVMLGRCSLGFTATCEEFSIDLQAEDLEALQDSARDALQQLGVGAEPIWRW